MKHTFLFFLVTSFLTIASAISASIESPNIVLLFADDMGYGDIGCYGHPTIATPHLDRMATEGMKFTQFHTASSVCTPSRAGLLTGRLPVRSGLTRVFFPQSEGGLPDGEITIAELLRETGYSSASIGKWHLGRPDRYLPLNHGFDYYFGDELWAVRNGPWKIHVKTTSQASVSTWGDWPIEEHAPPLLFHVEHDPSERHNVADSHPDVVAQMLRLMRKHEQALVRGEPQR